MNNQEKSEKTKNIIKDYKNSSNKELTDVLGFLEQDFNKTKDLIIKLTKHLDITENSYNKCFEEYKKRMNNG